MPDKKKVEMWRRQGKWIKRHWEISEYSFFEEKLISGYTVYCASMDIMCGFYYKKDAQAFKSNAIKFCEEQAEKCLKSKSK